MKNIFIITLCLVSFFAKAQDTLMTSKAEKRDTASLLSAYKSAIASHTTNIATNTSAINNRIKNDYYPLVNNSFVLGNSIAAGYLNAGSLSFVGMTERYTGSTTNNLSVSSTGIRFAYSQLTKNKVYNYSAPLLLAAPQFNDVRGTLTAQAVRFERAKAGVRAVVAMQWLNTINFLYTGVSAAFNSNITLSSPSGWAGFSTDAALLDYGSRTYWYRHNDIVNNSGVNAGSKTSLVTNETLTLTGVKGSSIVVGTWGTDGTTNDWSRIQYAVDGTIYGTYTPNGKTFIGYPDGGATDGIINDAIVVTGLSDSAHTVVLTFLDGGKKTAIDYIGSLINPAASYAAPIYSMDCFHMNNQSSIGYNLAGGLSSQSIIDSTTLLVNQTIAANFPGYRFIQIKTNQYYDPSNTTQVVIADGVHPTILGDQNIFKAIADSMSNTPVIGTAPVLAPSVQIAATLTANKLIKSSTSSTVINSSISDDGAGTVTEAAANPVFKIQDTNGTSAGFVGAYLTNTTFAVNRNPSTGTFVDAGKAAAQIIVDGSSGNAQILLATNSANNTAPINRVVISKDGITSLYKGAAVASTAAITPTGNLFHVTGTTTITSITSTQVAAGTTITIIFDGALTFTKGSNLIIASNLTTSINTTITLTYDGSNWYELSRSIN